MNPILQSKINELNSIDVENNFQLKEFVYRINKYTNGVVSGLIPIDEWDILLNDFDEIKNLQILADDIQNSLSIETLKNEIKFELDKIS